MISVVILCGAAAVLGLQQHAYGVGLRTQDQMAGSNAHIVTLKPNLFYLLVCK